MRFTRTALVIALSLAAPALSFAQGTIPGAERGRARG